MRPHFFVTWNADNDNERENENVTDIYIGIHYESEWKRKSSKIVQNLFKTMLKIVQNPVQNYALDVQNFILNVQNFLTQQKNSPKGVFVFMLFVFH